MAVAQSFFPEIRKQMLADSRRRQSREAGGGIADLVSPRRLASSPSGKKEDSRSGNFIVDEPFTPADSGGLFIDSPTRPLLRSASSHRIKAAAVAMAEAGSAIEEVVTEEVRDSPIIVRRFYKYWICLI